MNKLHKLLSSLFIMCSLVACTPNDPFREPLENEIKDASGNIIQIPDNPSSATAASVYAVVTPFYLALKMTDRVKAFNSKKPFAKNNDTYLSTAGNCGNGTVDLEKLAKYNPTCFIHRSNDSKTVKAVKKLKIDVIEITVENMDDVKTTLTMLGKYFGEDANALAACNYIAEEFTYIDNIVANIPQEEKVTAMLIGGQLGRIAGNDMLQTWMIQKAGGIPVVDVGFDHDWVDAGVEQVFNYNPDVLFATSSTALDYKIEDVYQDQTWSEMKAIQNERFYNIPCTNDPWDMPGLVPVLGTLYMLYRMYPTYLSENDFRTHINKYYTFMFGRTFTDNELGITL